MAADHGSSCLSNTITHHDSLGLQMICGQPSPPLVNKHFTLKSHFLTFSTQHPQTSQSTKTPNIKMRPSNLLALALTIIPASAQNFTTEIQTSVTVQSADFTLIIQSHNKTLNGQLLGACHDGAAHEGLCIVGGANGNFSYPPNYVTFQFNTSVPICSVTNSSGNFTIPCTNTPEDPTLDSGIVTWWLSFGDGTGSSSSRVSQAMVLNYFDNSNVALAQISFVGYCDSEFGFPVTEVWISVVKFWAEAGIMVNARARRFEGRILRFGVFVD